LRLLDTDVAVDVLRGRREALELVRRLVEAGEALLASEMTRFEVLVGMRRGEEQAIERFFVELEWIPVEEAISRRAASLARQHRAANVGIEDADFVIAATAVELDVPLVTRNLRHFPMLPGLEPAY
jgi:hypothetical protein